MSKKDNKFEKLPSGDYVFSDGITIKADKIRFSMGYSKLSDVDKRILEDTAGESYEVLTAKKLHEKVAQERAEEERKHQEFLARIEAQCRAEAEAGKKLFLDGKAFLIRDKQILKIELPPFDDETFRSLLGNRPMHLGGGLNAAIIFTPKNYPEYQVIICDNAL